MSVPCRLTSVRRPTALCPGECLVARRPLGSVPGVYVPLDGDGCAFVQVGVRDPESGVFSRVPCLVDSGGTTTALPRGLVNEYAFFPRRNRPMNGSVHRAALLMPTPADGLWLGLTDVVIVTAPDGLGHGILGANALLHVVSVFGGQALSLWERNESPSVWLDQAS